jgi:hypothetical protein
LLLNFSVVSVYVKSADANERKKGTDLIILENMNQMLEPFSANTIVT